MPIETGLKNFAQCITDFSLSPKVRAEKREQREFDAYLKSLVSFRAAFEPLRQRTCSLNTEVPLLVDERQEAGSDIFFDLSMRNTEKDCIFIGTTDIHPGYGQLRHVYRDVIHLDKISNFILSTESDQQSGWDSRETERRKGKVELISKLTPHPLSGYPKKIEAINRTTVLLERAGLLEDMRIASERKKEEQRDAEDREYD